MIIGSDQIRQIGLGHRWPHLTKKLFHPSHNGHPPSGLFTKHTVDYSGGKPAVPEQMISLVSIALMEESGIEKVSVQSLTSRAGISRGTFYLHYRDKYDLLEQAERELLDGLLARARRLPSHRPDLWVSEEEPDPGILDLFEYLAEWADAFRVARANGSVYDPHCPILVQSVART